MTTSRANVSTFGVNPPAKLREKLERRREQLVDGPATYDGVADRARVAARKAYLDRVSRQLETRADRRRARSQAVADELSDGDADRLHQSYQRRSVAPVSDAPGLPMTVDARPSYLTTAAVDGTTVPGLPARASGHPLVVRNTNVVSVPYADAVGEIVKAFTGPDRVSLGTATQVFRVSSATFLASGVDTPAEHEELQRRLTDSTTKLQVRLASTLGDAGLGRPEERLALVSEALSRWERPAARVRAFTNGSAAEAVHWAAVRKWPDMSDTERDTLALRLDQAVRNGLKSDAVRVEKSPTQDLAGVVTVAARGELRRKADQMAQQTAQKVGQRLRDDVLSKHGGKYAGAEFLAKLPMGVPIAPVPGLWYATVNFWDVEVRGTYAQFVVRVPRGAPDTPGGFRYVRDGDSVSLDIDADGERERLGRASRIRFRTGTDIVVGVPAGRRGVADVDGQAHETSSGWPQPGWK